MKKRMIAALLTGVMMLNLVACGGGNEEKVQLNVPDGTPSYEDDRQVEIGAYSGPRIGGDRANHRTDGSGGNPNPEGGWEGWITEEAFQDYMDCGFTYLMANADGYYDYNVLEKRAVTDFKDSDAYTYMELAQKMNIPVVVTSNFLKSLTGSADSRLTEEHKAELKQMVDDLSQYSVFKGFTFKDEPGAHLFKTSGAVKEYLDSLKPDLFYYTSCFPIYANLPLLATDNQDDKVKAYKEYVDEYSNEMGTFAYDHYALKINPVQGETVLDSTWFQNLLLVAEDAKEKGYAPGVTIQSCSYGPVGGEFSKVHNRKITDKGDVTFQLYTAMAYGFQKFSYFTYWQFRDLMPTEEFYGAMIDYPTDGTQNAVKTDAYYAVKEANGEIKKFDHVYLNYKWEGTMALTEQGKKLNTALSMAGEYQSPRVKEVTATNDTIIGCLKDDEGYDGFMIVNATDPGKDEKDSVTITFREASKAIAYISGEEETIELKNGTYTFELGSGEGVFVIPIK